MYMQNGWWFLSFRGSYPPVFTAVSRLVNSSLGSRDNTLGCSVDLHEIWLLKISHQKY